MKEAIKSKMQGHSNAILAKAPGICWTSTGLGLAALIHSVLPNQINLVDTLIKFDRADPQQKISKEAAQGAKTVFLLIDNKIALPQIPAPEEPEPS